MDATTQILAAYSGVISSLLDRLVEKGVLNRSEVQEVMEQVLFKTPSLHPHGTQALAALRTAVEMGDRLRTAKPLAVKMGTR